MRLGAFKDPSGKGSGNVRRGMRVLLNDRLVAEVHRSAGDSLIFASPLAYKKPRDSNIP